MKIRDCFFVNPTNPKMGKRPFISYLDTSSVIDGELIDAETLDQNFPSRAKRVILKGDILYSSVRPNLRHYYFYNDDYQNAIGSTGFFVLRKKANNINERFIYYFLSSDPVVDYLSAIAESSQSTFPACSPKDIGNITIPSFDLAAQEKISNVLVNYDLLIKNNKTKISVVESIIAQLYKEWFISFRFPGFEKVNVIGGAPENWSYLKFSDIFSSFRGVSYSSEEIDCYDGKNLINLKNINSYGGFRRDGTKKYNGKFKNEQMVSYKDLVMGVTDMTQERRTVGAVALIPDIKGVISADLIKLVSPINSIFSYCMFRFGFYSKLFSQFGNGTNVIHLKPSSISNQKMLIPPRNLIDQFVKIVEPMIDLVEVLNAENENLATQRDMLLPRLMSGKLDISGKEIV